MQSSQTDRTPHFAPARRRVTGRRGMVEVKRLAESEPATAGGRLDTTEAPRTEVLATLMRDPTLGLTQRRPGES
jgi:hypothetical protein